MSLCATLKYCLSLSLCLENLWEKDENHNVYYITNLIRMMLVTVSFLPSSSSGNNSWPPFFFPKQVLEGPWDPNPDELIFMVQGESCMRWVIDLVIQKQKPMMRNKPSISGQRLTAPYSPCDSLLWALEKNNSLFAIPFRDSHDFWWWNGSANSYLVAWVGLDSWDSRKSKGLLLRGIPDESQTTGAPNHHLVDFYGEIMVDVGKIYHT